MKEYIPMLKTMLTLGKMQFKQYTIYPSNFWLFSLNRIVEVMVYIFVWQAIYQQTGNAGGFSLPQMVTYYILAITFSSIATWGINEDMAYAIRTGQINKELLSPISYFKYYFGMNIGELAFAIVVGIAVFVIGALFWELALPTTFMNFVLCFVVMLLGIPTTFFLQMIVGTCRILYQFHLGNANIKKSNDPNIFWYYCTNYLISNLVSKLI